MVSLLSGDLGSGPWFEEIEVIGWRMRRRRRWVSCVPKMLSRRWCSLGPCLQHSQCDGTSSGRIRAGLADFAPGKLGGGMTPRWQGPGT